MQTTSIYLKAENLVSQFFLFYVEFSVIEKRKKSRYKEGDKHYSTAENLVDTVPSTIRNSIMIFMCGKKLYYSCKAVLMS